MKRFSKLLCSVLAIIVSLVACVSFSACEELKTIEVNVSVYDIEDKRQVESTLTIDLYRHLAPDTVDTILSYIEKGYYDGTIFYKESNYSNVLFGDFKIENGKILFNDQDYVKEIYGEFSANGTEMKNGTFVNGEGSIGLWRSWPTNGSYKTNNNDAFNSGKATIYMPADNKTEYDGFFCNFGKMDLSLGSENLETFSRIKTCLDTSSKYLSYTVYYTAGEGVGLVQNIMLTSDFNEDFDEETFEINGVKVFEAKGEDLSCYKYHTVLLPVEETDGNVTITYAKILSVKVK